MGSVYSIECVSNNAKYVGSTINFQERRYQHLSLLRGGKHHSRYLQRVYNKYGETSLCWSVLEDCEDSLLAAREQYWYEYLNPELNMVRPDRGVSGSNSKAVLQIDTASGKIMNRFNSIKQAAQQVGVSHVAISNVVRGVQQTSGGYRWVYEKNFQGKLPELNYNIQYHKTPVYSESIEGVIQTFPSMTEAAKRNGVSQAAIAQAIRNGTRSVGCKWFYAKDAL